MALKSASQCLSFGYSNPSSSNHPSVISPLTTTTIVPLDPTIYLSPPCSSPAGSTLSHPLYCSISNLSSATNWSREWTLSEQSAFADGLARHGKNWSAILTDKEFGPLLTKRTPQACGQWLRTLLRRERETLSQQLRSYGCGVDNEIGQIDVNGVWQARKSRSASVEKFDKKDGDISDKSKEISIKEDQEDIYNLEKKEESEKKEVEEELQARINIKYPSTGSSITNTITTSKRASNLFSDIELSAVEEGVDRHGTNFYAILRDPDLNQMLQGRSAQSIRKAWTYQLKTKRKTRKRRKRKSRQTRNNSVNYSDGSEDMHDSNEEDGKEEANEMEKKDNKSKNMISLDNCKFASSFPSGIRLHYSQAEEESHEIKSLANKLTEGKGWRTLFQHEIPIGKKTLTYRRCRHLCGCRNLLIVSADYHAVVNKHGVRNHERSRSYHTLCKPNMPCWILFSNLRLRHDDEDETAETLEDEEEEDEEERERTNQETTKGQSSDQGEAAQYGKSKLHAWELPLDGKDVEESNEEEDEDEGGEHEINYVSQERMFLKNEESIYEEGEENEVDVNDLRSREKKLLTPIYSAEEDFEFSNINVNKFYSQQMRKTSHGLHSCKWTRKNEVQVSSPSPSSSPPTSYHTYQDRARRFPVRRYSPRQTRQLNRHKLAAHSLLDMSPYSYYNDESFREDMEDRRQRNRDKEKVRKELSQLQQTVQTGFQQLDVQLQSLRARVDQLQTFVENSRFNPLSTAKYFSNSLSPYIPLSNNSYLSNNQPIISHPTNPNSLNFGSYYTEFGDNYPNQGQYETILPDKQNYVEKKRFSSNSSLAPLCHSNINTLLPSALPLKFATKSKQQEHISDKELLYSQSKVLTPFISNLLQPPSHSIGSLLTDERAEKKSNQLIVAPIADQLLTTLEPSSSTSSSSSSLSSSSSQSLFTPVNLVPLHNIKLTPINTNISSVSRK